MIACRQDDTYKFNIKGGEYDSEFINQLYGIDVDELDDPDFDDLSEIEQNREESQTTYLDNLGKNIEEIVNIAHTMADEEIIRDVK